MVQTSCRIDARAFRELGGDAAIVLFDTAPSRHRDDCRRSASWQLQRERSREFKRAPAAFKIDYALSEPVPWRAAECRRAITVHLGGTLEEIASGEK